MTKLIGATGLDWNHVWGDRNAWTRKRSGHRRIPREGYEYFVGAGTGPGDQPARYPDNCGGANTGLPIPLLGLPARAPALVSVSVTPPLPFPSRELSPSLISLSTSPNISIPISQPSINSHISTTLQQVRHEDQHLDSPARGCVSRLGCVIPAECSTRAVGWLRPRWRGHEAVR